VAKRKGWESLSPGYRERILKAGLTRQDYESGTSIKKARGHSKTPERPTAYDPKKFPQYAAERVRLTQELIRKKERLFGDRPRFNGKRSSEIFAQKPPSLAQLRWALAADESELIDAVRDDYETYYFIGYN
jgi:hypothetical protein